MSHNLEGPYEHEVMPDHDYRCDWQIAIKHDDPECQVEIEAIHLIENVDPEKSPADYFYLCSYHYETGKRDGLLPPHTDR